MNLLRSFTHKRKDGGAIISWLTLPEVEGGASENAKSSIAGVICAAPLLLRAKVHPHTLDQCDFLTICVASGSCHTSANAVARLALAKYAS